MKKDGLVIALSGGIDSSVAAYWLKEHMGERYKAFVGASHFIWPHSRCCTLDSFHKARLVCQKLNISYYSINLAKEFDKAVVQNFIATYLAGATPNPCVLCNEQIRFTLFFERMETFLQEKGYLAAEDKLYMATGHYVRLAETPDGLMLRKGADPLKDQSYMLYRLPKAILSRLIFPLGEWVKQDVYALARQWDLQQAIQRESQDACFVDTNYVDFLARQTGRTDLKTGGEIVDLAGHVLGQHRGYIYYTVGQRQGLGLGNGPWYVERIEPATNRVVVGRREEIRKTELEIDRLNWFVDPPRAPLPCAVKLRYQHREIPCTIEPLTGTENIRVRLNQPEVITRGQSAVFYLEDRVLGGGLIR
jgi:tRNA-specific 2-thiouridylase